MERKKVRWGLFLLAVLLCIWATHRAAEKVRERWEARKKESLFCCLQVMLQKSVEETMAPNLCLRSTWPMEWLWQDALSFLAPIMTMDLDGPYCEVNGDGPSVGEGAASLLDALSQENPFWEAERENTEYAEVGRRKGEENASIRLDLEEGPRQSMSGLGEISQAEPDLEKWNQTEPGREGLMPEEPGRERLVSEEPGQEELMQEELMQEELMREEIKQDGLTQEGLLPNKVRTISADAMSTYEELVKNFYVIDSTTMADASLLDAGRFSAKDLTIDITADGPQILIYHTHSQEAYVDSEIGDASQTVVGVGDELTRILTERYGYQVFHHTGVYDLPSRNGAYSRALPELEKILSENPSIQVVIDLHRDEMPEKVHLVTEIDGKQTARFMFFNGISRTRKTGELEYLFNPYLEDNLALSFQLEKAAQEYYPNLTRKIYLKGYRYNMHICPKTLLIELGAQNNTFEEAINACEPLASLLNLVLSGKERETFP